MYITYHKKIEKPENVTNSIPHEILCSDLQQFIIEHGAKQDKYFFDDNGFYFFIYLNNGDRIDCALNIH